MQRYSTPTVSLPPPCKSPAAPITIYARSYPLTRIERSYHLPGGEQRPSQVSRARPHDLTDFVSAWRRLRLLPFISPAPSLEADARRFTRKRCQAPTFETYALASPANWGALAQRTSSHLIRDRSRIAGYSRLRFAINLIMQQSMSVNM